MERKRSSRHRQRYRKRKTTCDKIKDFIREFIAFMFSNVGIIGLVVGYTICGAFMFQAIEGTEASDDREEAIKDIHSARSKTRDRLWEITQKFNVLEEEAWREQAASEVLKFQMEVIDAINKGYDGVDDVKDLSETSQWSFSGAFLYSLTVITTIGYGNVAPKTEWGKVATIFYAIIGMPLFLLYLSNIGDILAKSFKWSYAKCCLCRGCGGNRDSRSVSPENSVAVQVPEIIDETDEQYEESHIESTLGDSVKDDTITVPVTLCLAIMVGYVCGGAILFSKWEDWDFLDGSYFCFISLSTIGFGDIVPGDQIYASKGLDMSFIFCSMYLMLGMAIIAMCFNLMQEEVIHKFRSCVKAVKNCCSCSGARDDDVDTAPIE
ncbi:potassium channel subfamily K member 1 [Cloeon dipterum]|uniref:potassium channel subfamily K member 1 n=1 Tax=Cloeon dipterum TaxID=197152 RepID=UPI00321FD0D7